MTRPRGKGINILHLTPHLGGGVGRVLKAFISDSMAEDSFSHSLLALESADAGAKRWADQVKISLVENVWRNEDALWHALSAADLVHLHWWNHPLIYSFLAREDLPPFRVVLWSHVNGVAPPHCFTRALLSYPDIFVIANPYSLEAPAFSERSETWRTNNLRFVFSSSGIQHIRDLSPKTHEGITVGYIGTVDYCKMHRDFLRMSLAANIEEVTFLVCGGGDEVAIAEEAKKLEGGWKFNFRGHVCNVDESLSEMHIFGYPLCPGHFGTGEQALIEALAAGVPPVVLDNGPEKYIVRDGETGVIASSPEDYSNALTTLAHDPHLREEASKNAKEDARDRFSIRRTTDCWHRIYEEVMERPKSQHTIKTGGSSIGEGAALFLQSLQRTGEAELFAKVMAEANGKTSAGLTKQLSRLPDVYWSQTRGSAFHYQTFFPDDDDLHVLCAHLSECRRKGVNIDRM